MLSQEKKEKNELRILVVDDSTFTRRRIVNYLEEENFKVVGQASDAEEAIKAAVTTKANLLLIDIVMPKISGLELTKTCKEQGLECQIIVLSSLESPSVVVESISNGASDFIQKPFSKEDLIKAVAKVGQALSEEAE